MHHSSVYHSGVYTACQEHIAVLKRHNAWLEAELEKQRKKNNDRDLRTYMILSWAIVVFSIAPYLV